ncbi:MAG: phosphoenolpyruvate carboxylase [Candidatus Bathyarchaeia archaeon]
MRKIPRTMSTQHPDCVNLPAWCSEEIIHGEAEIEEAYYAYSKLGCMEVMWDAEGKDVDTRVVRKLLSKYEAFFKENILGEDVFLTYRIPNPTVETVEGKILLESLVNILVAHDIATAFYGRETSPLFEVILPLTTRSEDLLGLKRCYEKALVSIESVNLCDYIKVSDWMGSFEPKTIEVIPLIEDVESMLNVNQIIEPYIRAVKPEYLRVFLARSDPALNYGLICAVTLCKIALSKIKSVEKATGVEIFPIIGVGTMPFRGHLTPSNLPNFLEEYSGVYTVTIQSALKYDYPFEETKMLVRTLNEKLPKGEPKIIESCEEDILRKILFKFMKSYQDTVEALAPLINYVAGYVPPRRARKLHIGLFGYSRSVGRVSLPRAIPFAAALYTLGIPAEFIGLRAIENLYETEWNIINEYYIKLKNDLEAVAGFISWRNINMLADAARQVADLVKMSENVLQDAMGKILMDLNVVEEKFNLKLGPRNLTQRRYENAINDFLIAILDQDHETARKRLIEAARIRRCLG